jgi:hypothetical protein
MIFEHTGKNYNSVRGSDLRRDGMFLEVTECGFSEVLFEVFFSDADETFAFSCFKEGIPLEVIEHFIGEARVCLPPTQDSEVLPSAGI